METLVHEAIVVDAIQKNIVSLHSLGKIKPVCHQEVVPHCTVPRAVGDVEDDHGVVVVEVEASLCHRVLPRQEVTMARVVNLLEHQPQPLETCATS